MSVLNENEVKLYIQEKYISNTLSNENIFTDKIVKKIYRLSNGITDRVDILCLQYLDDPVKKATKTKSHLILNNILLLTKYRLFYLLLLLSIFVLLYIYIMLPFKLEDENIKQTLKIKLPEKIENEAKLDESLLIAMKEIMESPSDAELSATVISDLNHDDNHTAIDSTQNSNEEALMQLNDENKNEDIEITNSPLPITESKEKIEITNEEALMQLNDENKNEDIETTNSPLPIAESKEKIEITNNFKKDINWLVNQEPEKYVLQLISAIEEKTIKNYLEFFDNDDQIIGFSAPVYGKKRYILVYGLYDDSDLARAEIEKLPQKARKIKPWVRTVKSIKELLK